MSIDRRSSGSDQPPEDDAQRPRDNRPLDFTRPAYRPRHDLPDSRELYKDLFGEQDSPDATAQTAETEESTEKPSVGKHAEQTAEPAATKPDKLAAAGDLPAPHPVEQSSAEDRPGRPSDGIRPEARDYRLTTTFESADAQPDRHDPDRPTKITEPRPTSGSSRGWWEADPAEAEDSTPDRPTSQHVAETKEHRPDQPAEPQGVGQQIPAASTNLGQPRPSERIEQPPQPTRPQTLDERKAAYWAERGGETRHFPGWSGPEEGSSASPGGDQSDEPRASFVWGKVVYQYREDAPSGTRSGDAGDRHADDNSSTTDRSQVIPKSPDAPDRPRSPLGTPDVRYNPEYPAEEQQQRRDDGLTRAREVLDKQNWSNAKYAGSIFHCQDDELAEKYPEGVAYTYEGFPDFTPYARATVVFEGGFGDSRKEDDRRANEAIGLDKPPGRDWTWHHCEDGRTLHLVPRDLHDEARHWGGWTVTKRIEQRQRERDHDVDG